MPIYRFACNECGFEGDYLVSRVGDTPEGCKECTDVNLTRTFNGQTFATINASARITTEGDLEKCIHAQKESTTSPSKLEAGIHFTQGLTADGELALNVSRVQKDGTVDASVTGYKKVH